MSRGPARRAPAGAAAARRPAREQAGAPVAGHRAPWAWLGALALPVLLWASRGPTLGAPVADDYLFLSRLVHGRPLDWLGPMGAAYYWRPLSRQAYYLLLGRWLPGAPWLGVAVALALLAVLYVALYRLARHRFDPAIAAAIAAFPLLSEPARVLLAWPSATQHLLAAALVAVALERIAAGRAIAAGIAALLALLSNEAAALVLPALPLVAWLRAREGRAALRAGAAAGLAAVAWLGGYAVAATHGAALPHHGGAIAPAEIGDVLGRALAAQLGLEGLAPAAAGPVLGAVAALSVLALAGLLARAARRRLRDAWPALLGGAAWFVAGSAPLALLLPDWNAWRTTIAAPGLGFAFAGLLGLAWPPLALALTALRLVVLLLAAPAPAIVSSLPPATASSFSLARLTRLQRIAVSTRTALRAGPRLRSGGTVQYWNLPQLAEVGFAGPRALHVWADDTTLTWTGFGGDEGWNVTREALIEFDAGRPWPATLIEPRAYRAYLDAWERIEARDAVGADSLAAVAIQLQPGQDLAFHSLARLLLVEAALARGDFARADSTLRRCSASARSSPSYWAFAGRIALWRGDTLAARRNARVCLELAPHDAVGLAVARASGLTRP